MKRVYWIGIIVLLVGGGVATARFFQQTEHGKRQQAIEELEHLMFALDRYAKDNGDYPSTDQGIAALWESPVGAPVPPNWKGPYIDTPVVADPWGNPYAYRRPGIHGTFTYDLLSYGSDGVSGGRGDAEDIVSWLRRDEL